MAQMITISKQEYQKLLSRLSILEETVASMVKSLKEQFEFEPQYGSDEWWEWSMKKGREDIKKGRYKSFGSGKQLQKHLDSLK